MQCMSSHDQPKDARSDEERGDRDFDGELGVGNAARRVVVDREGGAKQARGDDEGLRLPGWAALAHPINGREVAPEQNTVLTSVRVSE